MLLTTTTLVAFLVVSVGALAVGIFSKRNEVYLLGVVLLLFMGLWTIQEGVSEQVGILVNETETPGQGPNNATSIEANHIYEYETTETGWTTGFGLLLIVSAVGLGLHFYKADKEQKEKKRDSIEIED